ncbi:hypothetical protein [Pseudorhodobacter wandonensis]|uniref:hypothetical protein n=1 Tax=Pseudorhodobacter wandonensis TaxID=1120568 RepID=UPI0012E31FCE|nr:hypothetical protein [Pseudorhodobacter wandonensis]
MQVPRSLRLRFVHLRAPFEPLYWSFENSLAHRIRLSAVIVRAEWQGFLLFTQHWERHICCPIHQASLRDVSQAKQASMVQDGWSELSGAKCGSESKITIVAWFFAAPRNMVMHSKYTKKTDQLVRIWPFERGEFE